MPDAAGLVLASDQDDARAYAEIVEQVTGAGAGADRVRRPEGQREDHRVRARHRADRGLRADGLRGRRHPAGGLPGLDDVLPHAAVLRAGRRTRGAGPRRGTSRRRCSCPRCARCSRWPPSWSTSATTSSRRPAAGRGRCWTSCASRGRAGGAGDRIELVDAEAAFAHVLHGGPGRGRRPDDAAALSEDDQDFLGLPGILSPEQTRGAAAAPRRRTRGAGPTASRTPRAACRPPSRTGDGRRRWRAGAELRREVNRLVGVLAARSGTPHGQVHAELRRAVPGPASAAASAELLERRRDHLMELLGGGRPLAGRRAGALVPRCVTSPRRRYRESKNGYQSLHIDVTPTPSGVS